MIEIGRMHHDWGKNILRSHHLHPGDEINLLLILEGQKENIISVIEDHLLETISSISWESETIENDFSYLSERYNQFIQNLEDWDLEWISCLIALSYQDALSIATIGNAEAILLEDEDLSYISSHDKEKHGFHYISHGEIPLGSSVYLSNTSLVGVFSESLLIEMSALNTVEWTDTIQTLAEEEKYNDVHVFRVSNIALKKAVPNGRKKQSDILIWVSSYITHFFKRFALREKFQSLLDRVFSTHRKTIQYVILIGWIILLFLLVYSLVNSLFSAVSSSTWDSKNELIRAQTLIIESQKLTNNRPAFNKNIGEAETILFRLRDDKVHMADTQDLLARIDVMKKEVNDIQSVDMRKLTSLVKFNPTDISPLWVFEYNKKLTVVWWAGAILEYSRGEALPKITPYPTGEVAKSFAASDDGTLYILTNDNRVINPRRGEFGYVTVTGENGWESAKSITVFNNNIYLLSSDGKSILRHRPGINGFSARTNMLAGLESQILNIAIDGWVYMVEETGKIQRFVSGQSEWVPKWLIINKIPGEYTIWQSEPLKIISQNNLVYVYILSGDRIWMFSPDSKRFQDISSLSYVAQLELESEEEIRDIFVPRDGSIYVTTNLWVYEVLFELVDGKILLR